MEWKEVSLPWIDWLEARTEALSLRVRELEAELMEARAGIEPAPSLPAVAARVSSATEVSSRRRPSQEAMNWITFL